MQNDSWLWRNLTEDERKQMLESHDRQTAQVVHNKPRVGFMFNCYTSKLGMFFQKTVKNTIIEKGIDSAFEGMLRYRCGGINRLYKYALKHPEEHDEIFQYEDRFLGTLNTTIKSCIYDIVSDGDSIRKRDIIRKATDIIFTLLLEDRFYYNRFKLIMTEIYNAIKADESILELDEVDTDNIERWNLDENKWNRVSSIAYRFTKTWYEYKLKQVSTQDVITELEEFEGEIAKMKAELLDE